MGEKEKRFADAIIEIEKERHANMFDERVTQSDTISNIENIIGQVVDEAIDYENLNSQLVGRDNKD
jgi:hypothetical protein